MPPKKSKKPKKTDYVCNNYDGLTGTTKFEGCVGYTSDSLITTKCPKCHKIFCSSCFGQFHKHENCNDWNENSSILFTSSSSYQCYKSSSDINIFDW